MDRCTKEREYVRPLARTSLSNNTTTHRIPTRAAKKLKNDPESIWMRGDIEQLDYIEEATRIPLLIVATYSSKKEDARPPLTTWSRCTSKKLASTSTGHVLRDKCVREFYHARWKRSHLHVFGSKENDVTDGQLSSSSVLRDKVLPCVTKLKTQLLGNARESHIRQDIRIYTSDASTGLLAKCA